LRDRPRRYLLVSVGTIFRTDSLSHWPERQQEDDRLGLPLVCLPLWLGGCDPYIPSCLYVIFMKSTLHIGLDR
jgi:hypothetical protein